MRSSECEECGEAFEAESILALTGAMLDHYAEEHPEHLD